MNLTDFLEQRLAEDEAIARAAIRAQEDSSGTPVLGDHAVWTAEDQGGVSGGSVSSGGVMERWDGGEDEVGAYTVVYAEGYPTYAQAVHIARHDPARVMREVEAKRAILRYYSELKELGYNQPGDKGYALGPVLDALAGA